MSARAVARTVLVAAAVVALLYLVYLIRSVVALVFIAVFIAVALGRPVDFLERLGFKRWLAILSTYLSVLAAVVVLGLLVLPPIVNETNKFVTHVPSYIDDLQESKTIRDYDRKYGVTEKLREGAEKLPDRLGDAVGALQTVTVGVFSALVQLITVLVMAFFMLLDGKRGINWAFGELGPIRGPRYRRVADDVYRSVGGYVVGNLLISLIAGLSTWIVLSILGVPFAVPLAVLMAFLDLIPLVGATIAGILIGIVAAIHSFPGDLIVWAIFLIVYQQVENNVVQPAVYRKTVQLHPLVVIIAVLIGSSLMGVLGALVAIPVAGALQIIARNWWELRRAREPVGGQTVAVEVPEGA
ncbi:MAG TPA: AI-2E family transporter [Thermoleophilaceae bacterium]|nr:AI-2E family transporter [Thermoleophilaceae bacterium]